MLARSMLLASSVASASALNIGQQLGGVQLTPLTAGFITEGTAPVALSSLYEERGAVIFAVRRPG